MTFDGLVIKYNGFHPSFEKHMFGIPKKIFGLMSEDPISSASCRAVFQKCWFICI